MRTLQQLNKTIIDLKKSGVDKDKSDPANGDYVLKNKVYYRKSDRPNYILKWCTVKDPESKNPKMPMTSVWKYSFGFDFVKVSDFDYAVEGIVPNGDGYFQEGDAILMKIPVEQYVKKITDERQEHTNMLRQQKRSRDATLKKSGAQIKDDMVSDILGCPAEPQKG